MNVEGLHKVNRAQPFQPCMIHLTDGRNVVLSHPELFVFGLAGRMAILFTEIESYEII